MGFLKALLLFFRAMLSARTRLVMENLALRQQLAVYKQSVKRPKLRPRDRIFWVCLSRLCANWRSLLVIVQPETVVRWHRQGFKLYWRWKSRNQNPGRPIIAREIRELIRTMSRDNPTWGAPRICSELLLLGYDLADRTVAKYMVRARHPPSQTWRTFLDNHAWDIAACDFFTVPTVSFRVLYVFIVLRHHRRQVVHFNVTTNPYAQWTAQQVVNAFPYEETPRFLVRDRDSIYGTHFQNRVKGLGIEEVPTAPRSPWQNPMLKGSSLYPSRMRESLDRAKRRPSEANLDVVFSILSRVTASPRAESKLPNDTPSGTTGQGQGGRSSASRRLASSLCTRGMIKVPKLAPSQRSVDGHDRYFPTISSAPPPGNGSVSAIKK